jgi:hypothetical protein
MIQLKCSKTETRKGSERDRIRRRKATDIKERSTKKESKMGE